MNALPPTLIAGRLRGSRRATPAAGVLAILIALVVAACGMPVTPTAPPSVPASSPRPSIGTPAVTESPRPDLAGLVVTSDGTPALGLTTDAGGLGPLDPPARPITLLRPVPNGLLAVLDDGSLAFGRFSGGSIDWTVDRRFAGIGAAAVDPSGATLATIDRRQLEEGRPLRLRIAHLGSGPARSISLDGLRANGPPAWLGAGHVALRATTSTGADVLAVVDVEAGRARTSRLDAIDIVASTDGRTAALVDAVAIRVGPATAIGESTFGQAVPLTAPADSQLAEVALDATGKRIAFAWEDEDQTPIAIEIATAVSGWRVVGRVDVPAGATRIRLAWSD